MTVVNQVNVERPLATFEGLRVSWGGIWAGTLVVLGTLLVLSTLGMAIGFSVGAHDVDPAKLGLGAVIWSRVSLLVALFLGGMAATRMSMVWDRATGLAQGILVWVVSLIVILLLSSNGVGMLLGVTLIFTAAAQHPAAAAPTATAWVTFISVVLSLLAALAGSALGQRRAAVRAGDDRAL